MRLVECKDCIYYNSETKGCMRNPSVEAWEEDDFCSYGVWKKIKACANCKWYRHGEGCVKPCTNADSENYGEMMFTWNYCEEWEGEE